MTGKSWGNGDTQKPWEDVRSRGKAWSTWLMLLLILCLCILLGALATTLPPPASPPAPATFTSVAYSTLLSEVVAGQVLAVHLEGDALNGLLTLKPTQAVVLADGVRNTGRLGAMDPDVARFLACWPEVTNGCFQEDETPAFPQTRLIYTLIPQQEASRLLALLLEKQVIVSIVRPYRTPFWVPWIWKYGPLWLFFLFVVGGDWPRAPRYRGPRLMS